MTQVKATTWIATEGDLVWFVHPGGAFFRVSITEGVLTIRARNCDYRPSEIAITPIGSNQIEKVELRIPSPPRAHGVPTPDASTPSPVDQTREGLNQGYEKATGDSADSKKEGEA